MTLKQITIIGTGLIGGSFGLAIRAAGSTAKIVGCDRQAMLDRAATKGYIHPNKAARLKSRLVKRARAVTK